MNIIDIRNAVSKVTGVTVEQISSKTRERKIVFARNLYIYFLKRLTNETLKNIGYIIRPDKPLDHTTVLHSLHVIESFLDTNDLETISAISLIEKDLHVFIGDDISMKQRISSIATILNTLPFYSIEPCRTLGELAEQLNKRLSA